MSDREELEKSVRQENIKGFGTLSDALADLDESLFTGPSHSAREHFEVVSVVAYLLGVPRRIFDNDHEPPLPEVYVRLEKDKSSRIIRDLCYLRNSIEQNFMRICNAINQEYKSITSVPEYVPTKHIERLSSDGLDFYGDRKDPNKYLISINKAIKSRIDNCKALFPSWLKWEYVKQLFIMPDGLTVDGLKAAAAEYYANKSWYPYGVYLNWSPEDQGNILFNDKKFVSLLYEWNEDEFREFSYVQDVNENTKNNIYEFLENSTKTVFMVDCENSDPYALCAAIRNLEEEKLNKIEKIVLYDDVHAASAWDILGRYVRIPIEYIRIERLKDNKSLADIKLTAGTCREYYKHQVDSFVLVSSDSDYWGLIESIPEAHFLVMVQHHKFSPAMRDALAKRDIFFCYIDDFYTGNSEEIKMAALARETDRFFDARCRFNLNDLMDEILMTTRIAMTPTERRQYMDRYLRQIEVTIDDEGDVTLRAKRK